MRLTREQILLFGATAVGFLCAGLGLVIGGDPMLGVPLSVALGIGWGLFLKRHLF